MNEWGVIPLTRWENLIGNAVIVAAVGADGDCEGGDVIIIEGIPVLEAAAVIDILKAGAVGKGIRCDGGDGGGDADGLQGTASGKGVFADGLHALGQKQAPKSRAAGEGI